MATHLAPASEVQADHVVTRLIRFYLRKYGPLKLFRLLVLRIWRRLFRNDECVFVYDCARLSYCHHPLPPTLTVHRYSRIEDVPAADIENLAARKGGVKRARALLEKFFRHQGMLWIIRSNNQFAGYHWTIRGGLHGYFFMPLTDLDAGIYAVEIFPEFRGQSIYPNLLRESVETAAREGLRRVYIGCKVWNNSSLRAQHKADEMGLAACKTVLGIAREAKLLGYRLVVWRRFSNPR